MSAQTSLNVNDIAKLSGVSRSTVSRVLTGHPNVKEATRQRVLEVIAEKNFKPNPAARALVLQRTQVLGLLIPHAVSDLFSDPFFPILIRSLTTAANHHQHSVMLWLTSSDHDAEYFYNQVLNHPLSDGLVITSAVVDHPLLERLEAEGKPFMTIGRPHVATHELNYVDVANREGAYMIVRHLIERGRKRIGFIPGLEKLIATQHRWLGYQEALWSANIPVDPQLIAPSGMFKESGGYESMKVLLERQVDAVFASSDIMALGAMRAIQEAGLRIPDDIAVGGFDDMPFGAGHHPSLTTIRQPIADLGKTAVEALIGILNGEVEEPYQAVLPVELVVRSST